MSRLTKVLGVVALIAGLIYAAFAVLQYILQKAAVPVRILLFEGLLALAGIAIGIYLIVSKDEDDEEEDEE